MNGRKMGPKGPKNAKIVRMRQKIVNLRHRFARKMAFLQRTNQKTKRLMDKKRLFYEAPTAQTVELCHENAMMQASLTGVKPGYGDGITDGWEDLV